MGQQFDSVWMGLESLMRLIGRVVATCGSAHIDFGRVPCTCFLAKTHLPFGPEQGLVIGKGEFVHVVRRKVVELSRRRSLSVFALRTHPNVP